MKLEKIFFAIIYRLSGRWMLRFFTKNSIYLYYHLISNDYVSHVSEIYPFKNIKQFEKDLDVLEKFFKKTKANSLLKLDVNKFYITFDDGFKEIYTIVYPLLKKRKIEAIFFINPNFVDNKKGFYKNYISLIISLLKKGTYEKKVYEAIANELEITYKGINDFYAKLKQMPYNKTTSIYKIFKILNFDIQAYLSNEQPYITKAQIQEMINNGFYFGGHTMNHPPLWELSIENQKEEIINSIEWLKENFNITYSYFAFPFSDEKISKKLIDELFKYDEKIMIFGGLGLQKEADQNKPIIQRMSIENPKLDVSKSIIQRNIIKSIYSLFNKNTIHRS
jgi:peptidoglycan/xylan/chitin deacetylase (PgdA/CDA1 family)